MNCVLQPLPCIGVGTRGPRGVWSPPCHFFGELMNAYTAKSHDVETIRDNLSAIGNPAVRARHNLDYVD